MALPKRIVKLYFVENSKVKMNRGDYFKARFVSEDKTVTRTVNVMGAVSLKTKPYLYIDEGLIENI